MFSYGYGDVEYCYGYVVVGYFLVVYVLGFECEFDYIFVVGYFQVVYVEEFQERNVDWKIVVVCVYVVLERVRSS